MDQDSLQLSQGGALQPSQPGGALQPSTECPHFSRFNLLTLSASAREVKLTDNEGINFVNKLVKLGVVQEQRDHNSVLLVRWRNDCKQRGITSIDPDSILILQGYAFNRILVDGFPTGDSCHESLDILILFLLGVRHQAYTLQKQLAVSCTVGDWAIEVSIEIPNTATMTYARSNYASIFGMPVRYKLKSADWELQKGTKQLWTFFFMDTKDLEKAVSKYTQKKCRRSTAKKGEAAAGSSAAGAGPSAALSAAAVIEEVVAGPPALDPPALDLGTAGPPALDLGTAGPPALDPPVLENPAEALDAAGAALTLRDDDAERDDGLKPSQIVDIPVDPGETMADPFGYFHNEYEDFRRTLPISEDEKPGDVYLVQPAA
jgi:hypothetical protein